MGVIRVLLAVSVIIAHVGPIFGINVVGAVIAVKAFYIISGFYMSLILNEKYIGTNNSYQLFLSNRLLRLFPIYWTVLLLTVLVSVGLGVSSHGQFWSKLQPWVEYYRQMGPGAVIYLIFTNLFLLGQDVVMFLGLNGLTGHLYFTADFWKTNPQLYTFLLIPQAWTVGLEITFYLMAPFIVRRKLPIILVLVLVSLSIRLLLGKFGLVNDPWNYRFFPSELLFFLLGNLSYRIYKRIEKADISKGLLAGVTIFVWLYTIFYGKLEIPFKEVVYFTIFFLAVPFIFRFSRKSRIDLSIGDLSYPMYIGHMLIVLFLGRMTGVAKVLGPGLTVAVAAAAFAVVLNRLVARPIEKIRQARVHTLSKPVLKVA